MTKPTLIRTTFNWGWHTGSEVQRFNGSIIYFGNTDSAFEIYAVAGPNEPIPGSLLFQVDAAGAGGSTRADGLTFGPGPSLPQSPTAVITPIFQTVTEGDVGVLLDGSSSIQSPSGLPITSYLWTQISGPTVDNLSDPTQSSITFDAPSINPSLEFELVQFELRVADANLQDTANATVRVNSTAAVGGGGDVLYASILNEVKRYAPDGAFIDVFVASGSGGLLSARGLEFGADSNLYVGSRGTGQVLRYDGTTGAFIDVFVAAGTLNDMEGLTFSPIDGHLYVADGNEVFRFDKNTGASLGVFGDASFAGSALQTAVDVKFGPDGKLYVVDANDGLFRYNGVNGNFELIVFVDDFATGALNTARGITFGPNGDAYITDKGNGIGEVQRFDIVALTEGLPNPYVVSEFSGGIADDPRPITIHPDGSIIYFGNTDSAFEIYAVAGPNEPIPGSCCKVINKHDALKITVNTIISE